MTDLETERKEHLLTIAKTLQQCQSVCDHYGLSDVSVAIEPAINALQKHVEFVHSPPEELLKFFGLDDLKEADDWQKKDMPET